MVNQITLLHESPLQQFGISSSASPQHNEKETSESQSKPGSTKENGNCEASVSVDSQVQDENDESGSDLASNHNKNENVKRRRSRTKQTVFADSDSDLDADDLSRDDLMKLVAEKEELLKTKDDEFQKMKDKVLRSYAEMENVMNRAKREAENSKKFAIQVSFSSHMLCQGVLHLLVDMLCYLVIFFIFCINVVAEFC